MSEHHSINKSVVNHSGACSVADSDIVPFGFYSPTTGTWRTTGSLNVGREQFQMLLLPDGTVLAAGGQLSIIRDYSGGKGNGPSAELYSPATGLWAATGDPTTYRINFQMALLSDGTVLAAGGTSFTDSAELYIPMYRNWTDTGSLNMGRSGFQMATLPNGDVLAAGGDGYLDSAEVYSVAAGTWALTGSLTYGRSFFQMVALLDGTILAAGGLNNTNQMTSAELYNPMTRTWSPTGSLARGRHSHAMVLLPDGTVLAAGGFVQDDLGVGVSTSAEVYDPATGTWSTTADLVVPRDMFQMTVF